MRSILRIMLAAGTAALCDASTAQQACSDIPEIVAQCPAGGKVSGVSPDCLCDGSPTKPPPLTCERNFGCPNASFVGQGKFPECVCRQRDEPGSGGGRGGGRMGGRGVGGGLGGTQTCEQFFVCPDGFKMDAAGGLCQCVLTMQPALKK